MTTRRRQPWGCALVGAILFGLATAAPARAEGKKETENTMRFVVMVPMINPGTQDIQRIMPITVDLTIDTPEAKESLINYMPKFQDAYLQGTYGKVYTDWGYDRIQSLFKTITEHVAGDELKQQIHVSIRVNVKAAQ